MSKDLKDLKKEVQEAPLLWPLTPIPTFDEVYDPKICTEASREISTIFEGWLHPKHEMAKPEALGKIRVLECGHGLSLIHISEPTRLGMISYAVFCLKKKKKKQ